MSAPHNPVIVESTAPGGQAADMCRIESNIRVEQNIYFVDAD